jgi:predicted Fe-Mo cluster-binding NifX family protein
VKIAITTKCGDPNCEVCQRFGRTPWLLFLDTVSGLEAAVAVSQNTGTDQGFGIQTARRVVQHGAQAVLTGHCGPRAFEVLKEAGVFVYSGIEGTAAEAATWLKDGFLVPSGKPNKLLNWCEVCEPSSDVS